MTRPRTQWEVSDLHWRMERAQAETVACPWCEAEVGEHCRSKRSGDEHPAPAHWQRIRQAGKEAAR